MDGLNASPEEEAAYWKGEFEGMKEAFEQFMASSKGIEAEQETELEAVSRTGHPIPCALSLSKRTPRRS